MRGSLFWLLLVINLIFCVFLTLRHFLNTPCTMICKTQNMKGMVKFFSEKYPDEFNKCSTGAEILRAMLETGFFKKELFCGNERVILQETSDGWQFICPAHGTPKERSGFKGAASDLSKAYQATCLGAAFTLTFLFVYLFITRPIRIPWSSISTLPAACFFMFYPPVLLFLLKVFYQTGAGNLDGSNLITNQTIWLVFLSPVLFLFSNVPLYFKFEGAEAVKKLTFIQAATNVGLLMLLMVSIGLPGKAIPGLVILACYIWILKLYRDLARLIRAEAA